MFNKLNNLKVQEYFKRDHYNLCDIFKEKSNAEFNEKTDVFTLIYDLQRVYLDYYLMVILTI